MGTIATIAGATKPKDGLFPLAERSIPMADEYKRITLRLPFEMWKRMLSLTIDSKLAGKNETVTDIALAAIERELNRREKAGK